MIKVNGKRMLLAAATATSLAALMAPQVASAAEAHCQGRQECQTHAMQAGKDKVAHYRATAQKGHSDRAHGKFEVRNARNGYRVKDGRFYGSTYGRVEVKPYNAYKLKVESGRRTSVTGRLWG